MRAFSEITCVMPVVSARPVIEGIVMARDWAASLEYRGTRAGVLNPGQDPNRYFCLIPGTAGGHRQTGPRRQHGSWRPHSN